MTQSSAGQIAPGLRVLVTAGVSGTGRAIARTLIDAGARVHVCDIDEAALDSFRDEHPQAGVSLADVSSVAAVESLFNDIEDRLGGLDVLVNNAGIVGPAGKIEAVSPEAWRRTLDVNLTGTFLCTRRAVPMLRASGQGSVINLGSASARLGVPYWSAFTASKWGVIGLTQCLAKELGPDGIRVNAILPGAIAGQRTTQMLTGSAEGMGLTVGDLEEVVLANVSLHRWIEAEDVAAMVLFLCTPAAHCISGQSLGVCGNLEAV